MLKNIFTKGLFILGILIVVVILAFAVVKILPKVFSGFATVGDTIKSPFRDKTIDLTINNSDLKSGETTAIYWDYETSESGSYEIRYACVDNLQVNVTLAEGIKRLLCNTPYKLSSNVGSLEITPTLTKENILVDLPFYIKYSNDNGEILADGNQKITVTNQKVSDLASAGSIIDTAPVKPAVTPVVTPVVSTPVQPTYVAPRIADLAISDMVAFSEINNSLPVAFTVSNIGTSASGSWLFSYTTPDGEVSYSPVQISLNPGDAVRFTMRFDKIGRGVLSVRVDPYNYIYERSELNNVVAINVNGAVNNSDSDDDYNSNDDADLEIRDLMVGRMSGSSFREDDVINEDDDSAVRFTVLNRGGESTGTWRYEIDNTPDGEDYRSDRQDSLRPGESTTITVKFRNPDQGTYRIKVNVDSDDDVDEEKESNNDETETLEVEN